MDTARADRKVLIYAHRGASKLAPENTTASFKKAAELEADGVELDVQLTADGHIVVLHDESLGRTCNGSGNVKDLRLGYLRGLDFGGWFSDEYSGEKIPLLEEVMDLAKRTGMFLNIEIKAVPGKYNTDIEDRLAFVIKDSEMEDRIIISSFNHYSLVKIKKIYQEIKIAPLYVGIFTDISGYALRLGADFIHPVYDSVTNDVICSCRDKGIGVNVWTVDKVDDIGKMAEMGVYGIITNRPDAAVKILKETK